MDAPFLLCFGAAAEKAVTFDVNRGIHGDAIVREVDAKKLLAEIEITC